MKLFFLQEIDDLLAGGLSQEEEDDVLEELDQIIQVGTPEDIWEDPTCQGTSLTLKARREHSGRVLDSRPRGRRFEPHRRHCIVVLEQDAFILA